MSFGLTPQSLGLVRASKASSLATSQTTKAVGSRIAQAGGLAGLAAAGWFVDRQLDHLSAKKQENGENYVDDFARRMIVSAVTTFAVLGNMDKRKALAAGVSAFAGGMFVQNAATP